MTRFKSMALAIAPSVLVPLAAHAFTYQTEWSFTAPPAGNSPRTAITPSTNAKGSPIYYGTTDYGGKGCAPTGCGTIYSIAPPLGAQDLLHRFTGFTKRDTDRPSAVVVKDGLLYGTTNDFSTKGELYSFDPSSNTYTTIHKFDSRSTGEAPLGVIIDSAGNMWGAANSGGTGNTGVVWEIPLGGTYLVRHSFGPFGSSDGQNPMAGVFEDAHGDIWGTTIAGGSGTQCAGGSTRGCGTIFEITAAGAYSTVYSFDVASSTDGFYPDAALSADSLGNIWGTTLGGGSSGYGIIFEVTTSGAYSVYHDFTEGSDGGYPSGQLLLDSSGNLWGTTEFGGASGDGTIYRIDSSSAYSVPYIFGSTSSDGKCPTAGLSLDSSGNMWGTTSTGGANGVGTAYEAMP